MYNECLNVEFGDRLKLARDNRGLGQEQLSQLTGGQVSKQSISHYETGRTKITNAEVVFLLSDCLNADPRWLATGEGAMDASSDAPNSIDIAVFSSVYKLYEDAILLGSTEFSMDVKVSVLIAMYQAALKGRSPAQAMLEILLSQSTQ